MVEEGSPRQDRRERAEAEASAPTPVDPFERGKRLLLIACGAIAGGLAIAGSIDRSTGGVVLLAGWLAGVAGLHRLGRAGSTRRASGGSRARPG